MKNVKKCLGLKVLAVLAIAFGLLTLKSGGEVLFIDGTGRATAGNYVPFVLLVNFIMGFLYIVAGLGLWLQKGWAAWLAIIIVLITFVVFAALAWHINSGGLFEQRTIMAMTMRSGVWSLIAVVAYFRLIHQGYSR